MVTHHLTDRIGLVPILSVKRSVTIGTMIRCFGRTRLEADIFGNGGIHPLSTPTPLPSPPPLPPPPVILHRHPPPRVFSEFFTRKIKLAPQRQNLYQIVISVAIDGAGFSLGGR